MTPCYTAIYWIKSTRNFIVFLLDIECKKMYDITINYNCREKEMETRVAIIGIIVENEKSVEELNALLHE